MYIYSEDWRTDHDDRSLFDPICYFLFVRTLAIVFNYADNYCSKIHTPASMQQSGSAINTGSDEDSAFSFMAS